MKRSIFFSLCLAAIFSSMQVNAQSQVFTKASFEKVKKQHLGVQWLMILWSVDCPPCFKELSIIEKMRKQQPDLAVVIINADDTEEVSAERERIIKSYNLASLPNYYFADGLGDQSRYLIDSTWYGELPRSYFFEKNGKYYEKSGLVSEALIQKWLGK